MIANRNKNIAPLYESLKQFIAEDIARGMSYKATANKYGLKESTLQRYCIEWKLRTRYTRPFKEQIEQGRYIITDVEADLLTAIFPPDYKHGLSKCMNFAEYDHKWKTKDCYDLY